MSMSHDPSQYKPNKRYGDGPTPEERARLAEFRKANLPRLKPVQKAQAKSLEQITRDDFEQLARRQRSERLRLRREGQLTPAERERVVRLEEQEFAGRSDAFSKEDRRLLRRGWPMLEAERRAAADQDRYKRLRGLLPTEVVDEIEAKHGTKPKPSRFATRPYTGSDDDD